MANNVKEAWKNGKAVVNGWLAIPNAFSAEMFSQCGWDSVTVDMQHGVQDYLSCVSCFQGIAASGSGATPMVRVPWGGYLLYCTSRAASSGVLTIGQITP